MDKWDQEKLESVVANRHQGHNHNKPTEIVCKFFLEAIETGKYGWFWSCINGDSCKYRHALPPGYVLKKKETEEERREREEMEKENQITIEDFLETEVPILKRLGSYTSSGFFTHISSPFSSIYHYLLQIRHPAP